MDKLKRMLLYAILAVLTAGCGGTPEQEEKSFALEVSPSTQTVVALGEQITFKVISATDWYVRSSAPWAKAVTATGGASSSGVNLVISCEENRDSAPRSAVLTVSNLGKESVTVSLEQEAGSDAQIKRGISTAEDLVEFAKAANGEGSMAKYLVNGVVKLLNDIDASSIKEWIPAGTAELPFSYSINGDGHSIKNVNWVVDLEKYPAAGLIGYAKNITIESLTFGSKDSQVKFTGNPSSKVEIGGIVGTGTNLKISKTTNEASLTVTGNTVSGENLVIGGIIGRTDASCMVGGSTKAQGCVNRGNITVVAPATEGGIVGYNLGSIKNCSNYGTITGPAEGSFGPGWLCSINKNKTGVTSNYGYGFVGTTPALMKNSMMNYEVGYDMEGNTVDWTLDAYYDWNEVETRQLRSGLTYHHYDCINVPQHIHVMEIDLTDPGIEIDCAFAGEMAPNPNANGNHNNGFNLRETLSMLCNRRRTEGQKIIGGINGAFFDSNDGVSRGFLIEDCEPVYINNPSVVQALKRHVYALTTFTDGTASLGSKKFTGKLRKGGKEYNFYTYNDTTMRHASPTVAPVNLYNWRYVRTPYPDRPDIVNDMGKDVLYVICEYTADVMKVNTGYASAKVIDVRDGRSGSIELPYLTDKNQVGIALSGSVANEWSTVKVGDAVELKCDMAINGDASKPIYSQISATDQHMVDGKDHDSINLDTDLNPKTFPVVSEDGKKVWLVVADGRQDWYSKGINGYELYRIAKKLGGWWACGFDGGGSSTMWVWDPSKDSGNVVNSLTRGERSCLNYVLIREKQNN